MARNKIGLQFEGFKEYAEQFEKMGGDLKRQQKKPCKIRTIISHPVYMRQWRNTKIPGKQKRP